MPSTRSKNRISTVRKSKNFYEEANIQENKLSEQGKLISHLQDTNKHYAKSSELEESMSQIGDEDTFDEQDFDQSSSYCEYSKSTKGRKAQTEETLRWLDENYVMCDGVCLPRCILYAHYLDFCRLHNMEAACAATFGKTIRQKFPQLTTRRLGTRGHSKYHYYGIGIKETSTYYHSMFSGKGLTRFSGIEFKNEGIFLKKYSPSSRTGTLLPDFPNPKILELPENAPAEKVETLIIMYKTHCQCILDTAINSNFLEINNFLLHFWQGMPNHLLPVVQVELVANLICLCDSILYKVLIDVLVPSTMQDMPESLLSDVRGFARKIEQWVVTAVDGFPEYLAHCKRQVARQFALSVRRQTSFLHLAQTARPIIQSSKMAEQMAEDLERVDFPSLGTAAMFTSYDEQNKGNDIDKEVLDMLRTLLEKAGPVENYVQWMDNIVERRVMKEDDVDPKSNFKTRAQEFLLQWSFTGGRLMHNLTLNNCTSFGSFHLLRMLMDEYMFLAIETRLNDEYEEKLQANLDSNLREDGSNKIRPSIRMTPFITKTKFTVSSNKSPSMKETIKSNNNIKPGIHKKKSRNQQRQNSLLWSQNNSTGGRRRKTKPENGKSFENHSPGTIALTPPVSPLYNNLHTSGFALHYTDPEPESLMSCQADEGQTIWSNGNPSSEAIDDLVSEHFRNCGVNPLCSETVGYNETFHYGEPEPFSAHDRLDGKYTLSHQPSITTDMYPYHHEIPDKLLPNVPLHGPSNYQLPGMSLSTPYQCNKGKPLINYQPNSSMIFYPDGMMSDSVPDNYAHFFNGHEEGIDDAVGRLFDGACELGPKVDEVCDTSSLPSINSLLNAATQMY